MNINKALFEEKFASILKGSLYKKKKIVVDDVDDDEKI
jgi:hypothetical protein